MRDKTIGLIEQTNEALRGNVIKSGDRLNEIIGETEKIKNKADREIRRYFDRHRIIDYLVYINLIITPILFLIVIYILFLKK